MRDSAMARGLKYYPLCVPKADTHWEDDGKYTGKEQINDAGKCSWKYLHSVDGVLLNEMHFLSLYRQVERDMIISGTVKLVDQPIILMNPHANG